MEPQVDIIILNYNGLDFTPKCVESLYRNTDVPFHLIIVDNQSTDGSEDYLNFISLGYDNLTVHYNEELDSGFAAGVNIGLKYAKTPYVLLLNNDIVITQKNWLSRMLKCFEDDPKIGVVTPKLLYPDKRIQYAGASFYVSSSDQLVTYHIGRFKPASMHSVSHEVPVGTFACVLIKRELLKDGLDEAYLLGTFEDVDFCQKIRRDGFKVWYCADVTLYHYETATQFARPMAHFSLQHETNALLFARRWEEWVREDMKAHPEVYRECK